MLISLPAAPFELAEWKQAIVQNEIWGGIPARKIGIRNLSSSAIGIAIVENRLP